MSEFPILKVKFTPPWYPDHTVPNGLLPKDARAQACWHFYTLVQQMKEKVGKSIDDQFGVLEGNPWMDKRYVPVAHSICMIHGLNNPDEFGKFWKYVWAEAKRCKLPEPSPEYTKLQFGIRTVN
jgi:hypothetical protein